MDVLQRCFPHLFLLFFFISYGVDAFSQDLSANSIPSKFYRVNPIYKSAYKHINQKTNECSWTSYVLAAGAIAKGKGKSYEVSSAKIKRVKDWCRSRTRPRCTGNYYDVCGSHIAMIASFGNNNDKPTITSKTKSRPTTYRIYMVQDMLHHIDTYGTPFLALGKKGNIGHYYIIWSIDWKQGGTGSTVWYTDPSLSDKGSFDANIRSMSLTALIDSMRDNPDASYLNILSMY